MLIFFKDNDNLIRWDGMARASDGTYVNGATVTYVLKDSNEAVLATGALPYVAGSNGRYQGVVDHEVALGAIDDMLWLELTAVSGTLDGFRRILGRVVYRKEN